mmetsp:Transcript_90101/g.259769  ORF Transcript_90101/g.259769 Transcript_90101/m.259769 type:complete len:206 (+) Transcript_90101:82-699(+)
MVRLAWWLVAAFVGDALAAHTLPCTSPAIAQPKKKVKFSDPLFQTFDETASGDIQDAADVGQHSASGTRAPHATFWIPAPSLSITGLRPSRPRHPPPLPALDREMPFGPAHQELRRRAEAAAAEGLAPSLPGWLPRRRPTATLPPRFGPRRQYPPPNRLTHDLSGPFPIYRDPEGREGQRPPSRSLRDADDVANDNAYSDDSMDI